MDLLQEDIGFFDLTTSGLGIGEKLGVMKFAAREEMILCGFEYAKEILAKLELEYKTFANDGDQLASSTVFLECFGTADKLHKAWKITQNVFEYMSAIATKTERLSKLANLPVLTTRKNLPNAKELMQKAVFCGGGAPHRLGTFDSILIFDQHLEFLQDEKELKIAFANLKRKFIERKIAVEVDSYTKAEYFANLGADVLQCEKMSFFELKKCVTLKSKFANLVVVATGGINETNIQDFASCGVDAIVTSAPYHAKPLDVKVTMEQTAV